MYIIIPILLVLLAIGLLIILDKDILLSDVTIAIAVILVALFSISAIVFGINAGYYLVVNSNMEAYRVEKIEMRDSYVALLDKYDNLVKQDITASNSYFSIYAAAVDFNKQVRLAQTNKDRAFWTEGLLYDPSYIDIEPIEIKEPYK